MDWVIFGGLANGIFIGGVIWASVRTNRLAAAKIEIAVSRAEEEKHQHRITQGQFDDIRRRFCHEHARANRAEAALVAYRETNNV